MLRHQLIFVDHQANFSIQSCHINQAQVHREIALWFSRGLPCIYTRQSSDQETMVNLGLPLKVADKTYRIALMVEKSAILKQQNLPTLLEMQDFFLHYHGIEGIISALTTLAKEYPVFINFNFIAIYGSFLFHYLAGQSFVNANSDLDLLINYPQCSLNELQVLVQVLGNQFNRVIDGEIRFKRLGDFSIKELFDFSAKKIVCKNRDKVELISKTKLYEYYPALCCY